MPLRSRRPAPLGEAPEPTYGLRRPAPLPEPVTWDARSDAQREWDATIERTRAALPTTAGVARGLLGDDAGASAHYARARQHEQRAAELDSDVDPMALISRDASLGERLAAARKAGIGSIPSLATGIGGGFAGAALGRRLATGAARRGAQRQMQDQLPAPTSAADEMLQGDMVRSASRAAVRNDPAAQARIQRAGRAGAWAGGTAATAPVLLPGSLDYLEGADQADTAKIAATTTGAAALGFLPLDRLAGRVFRTPVAQEGVRQALANAPRRVLKQAGLQAGSEGLTEIGQEVLQRAGHKWVDENVQMLSPEALQEYALAGVAGALIGGAMGGSVETGRSGATVGRAAWDATGDVRAQVRSYLESVAERTQAGVDRSMAAMDRARSSPEAQGAADLFRQAREAAGGAASATSQAGQRFWQTHVRRQRDRDLDGLADEVMARYDEILTADDSRPMPQAVARAKTPEAKFALSFFRADYLDGKHPDDADRLGRILAKVAQGKELSAPEARSLAFEIDNPDSGLDPAAMAIIGKDGGQIGERWRAMLRPMSQTAGFEQEAPSATLRSQLGATADEAAQALAQEQANAQETVAAEQGLETDQEGELDLANWQSGITESMRADGDELTPLDRMLSLRQTGQRLRQAMETTRRSSVPRRKGRSAEAVRLQDEIKQLKRGVANARRARVKVPGELERREQALAAAEERLVEVTLRDRTPVDHETTAQARAELQREYDAALEEALKARDQVRAELLDRPSATWTANFDTSTSRREFERRSNPGGDLKPNYVALKEKAQIEVTDKKTGEKRPAERAQLLDLGNMIGHQRQRINREGTVRTDIPAKVALMRGLAEAKLAGIEFDLDTLVPGPIYRIRAKKDGKRTEYERERLLTVLSEADVAQIKNELAQVEGVEITPADPTARQEALDREFERNQREDPEMGEDVVDSGQVDDARERIAREPPPGVRIDDDFVSSMEDVADVRTSTPYARTLAKARRERDRAKTPAARRAVAVAYGTEIGMRELARRLTNEEITQRQHDAQLKALQAENGEAAIRYLNRAAKGEFDSVSVTHARRDSAAPATGRDRDEWRYQINEEGNYNEADAPEYPKFARAEGKSKGKATQRRPSTAPGHRDKAAVERKPREPVTGGGRPNVKRLNQTQYNAIKRDRYASQLRGAHLESWNETRPEHRTAAEARRLLAQQNGESMNPAQIRAAVETEAAPVPAKKAAKKTTKKVVKKAAAKKAPTKEAAAPAPTITEARATIAQMEDVAAKKTVAKKTVAKKTVAKKAAPKTVPAPDTSGRQRMRAEAIRKIGKADATQLRQMIAQIENRILSYDGSEDVVEMMREERSMMLGALENRIRQATADNAPAVESMTAKATAADPQPKHDLAAEKRLLNAWLAQLGVKHKITGYGAYTGSKRHRAGAYNQGEIRISDYVHGAERVSVIAHEFGHHLYISELAVALGLPLSQVQNMSGDTLLSAMRQHRPEIAAEYDAWMAERGSPARVDATQQAPLHRVEGVAARHPDSQPQRPTNFHEWMADNIAKALLGKRETRSKVGQFFKDIADILERAYSAIFGDPALASFKPAASVEAWVNDLFDANARAVREVTGAAVDRKGAEATVEAATRAHVTRAAARDLPPSGNTPPTAPVDLKDFNQGITAMMRFVRNAMPAEERRILDRATNTPAARKAIEETFKGTIFEDRAMTLMNSAAKGVEARIALAYHAHLAGGLKVGPKGTSALLSVDDTLLGVLGAAGQGRLAERIFNDLANGIMERHGKAYSVRKREALVRGWRQQMLNAIARAWETASDAIGRALDGKARRMMGGAVPELRRWATMLQKPTGAYEGDRGLIPAMRDTTARFGSRVNKAYAGLSRAQALRAMRTLQRGDTDLTKLSADERRAVRQTRRLMDDMYDYMKEAGVKVGRRENFFPILLDTAAPNFDEKLTRLLSDPDYEAPIREFMASVQPKTPAKRAAKARHADPSKVEVDPAAIDFFDRLRARLEARQGRGGDEHIQRLIEVNEQQVELLRSGTVAQLERAVESTSRRMDSARSKEAKFTMEKEIEHFNARIAQLQGAPADAPADAKGADPKTAPIADLVAKMVHGAQGEPYEGRVTGGNPNFRGMNFRAMEFIDRLYQEALESGDQARIARHRKNVESFARLQVREPADVIARYIVPMVKHAEYTRRFGADGKRLEVMAEKAAKQGATESQIKEAKDATLAALGLYGLDESPTLRAISPGLAQRFSGERTKAAIHGLQAYQNLRLLPLAMMSSFVEPIGIAVRSGGDFNTAWEGFRTGVRSLYSKASREELRAALDALGATDDMFAEVAIHQDNTKFTHRVNTILFKYNGLTAWTRATRFMALTSAHGFMLRHAGLTEAGTNDHSARYLRELGLRDGDVQADGAKVRLLTDAEREAADAKERARDDRVRSALMQFVDEAIIRPNSQQTPMWVSDPYMGLFAQYKAFAYAMYDQIPGRMFHEIGHGNMVAPVMAALAYVPVMLMGELLREILQNLGRDERREDWGLQEYAWLAFTRTGMIAPRAEATMSTIEDVQRGQPGSSALGPTGQQARDLYRAATGRRSLAEEAQRALPGAALHRRWDEVIASRAGGE